MKVKDIPANYTLVQNGSEVAELLEYLGTDAVSDGYSYLFVDAEDGEILGAYGSYTCGLNGDAYLIR